MKRIPLIILCSLLLFACIKGEKHDSPGTGDIDLPISGGDDDYPVQQSDYTALVFEVINLDYPGLETVKRLHSEGKDGQALNALREYYRSRNNVLNPKVNLVNPSLSAGEKNIADQACRERGYRLYIKNYAEGTDPSTGLPLYWSFADASGNLDWNKNPGGITEKQFSIQRHRHHWMENQAKAYRVTGDDRYVDYIIDIYSSWLKAFPFPGAHKLSSREFRDQWTDLQASDRVMSQINILQYCVRSDHFTTDWLALYLVEFANTVESIRCNPYATESSNHRLFEVQAVFTAAVLMPEFKNASIWLEEGLENVATQVKLQFRSDGVQVEMDPSYHITVLNNFYEIHQLAKQNGLLDRLPADYTNGLRAAAAFVRDIIYTNYSMDNFNDTRSVSWSKSVLKRNFGYWAEMFPDEPGLKWFATERGQGSAPDHLSASYPVSGYYVLRDGWEKQAMMLVLKNNDNARGWWHCQPDNGTFGLYRNGRRFTPDAGSYSYGGDVGDNAQRADFQATKMHNTLTVGLANIPDENARGRFVSESLLDDGTDIFIVANDSYSNLSHRRQVHFVKRKFFVILDEGIGDVAIPSVELSFHLCDGVGDVAIDDYGNGAYGAHTVFSDGNNMIFKTFAQIADGFEGSNGESYYSDAIGQKVQRRFYRVSSPKQAGSPLRFVTVICPLGAASGFSSTDISANFSANAVNLNVNGTAYSIAL
ncbi:MAG: alginate lyase family protein [Bacteroidales bacterium]|nr:alginate lyase family protein [Bacteroidales bacterium]